MPERLATIKTNATDYDEYGCSKSLNNGAKTFNAKLNALCEELRSQMKNATIVYVDMYSIKYGLIANSASYGEYMNNYWLNLLFYHTYMH